MISETCTGYDVKSGTPCHRQSVADVTAGCVHEHIGTRSLCQFHIADLAEGQMKCGNCLDCQDPHDCELVADTRSLVVTQ